MTKRKRQPHWIEHAFTLFCVCIIVGLLGAEAYFILTPKHNRHFTDQCFHVMDEDGVHVRCEPAVQPTNN